MLVESDQAMLVRQREYFPVSSVASVSQVLISDAVQVNESHNVNKHIPMEDLISLIKKIYANILIIIKFKNKKIA